MTAVHRFRTAVRPPPSQSLCRRAARACRGSAARARRAARASCAATQRAVRLPPRAAAAARTTTTATAANRQRGHERAPAPR
eukprot:2008700-Pleurochrysis_carterae.AAC.2